MHSCKSILVTYTLLSVHASTLSTGRPDLASQCIYTVRSQLVTSNQTFRTGECPPGRSSANPQMWMDRSSDADANMESPAGFRAQPATPLSRGAKRTPAPTHRLRQIGCFLFRYDTAYYGRDRSAEKMHKHAPSRDVWGLSSRESGHMS